MFMAMEAPALVERKDMAYGLILLRISISTVFFGQILRSCMYDAIYLNPTCHIWLLHFPCYGKTSFFNCPIIAFYTLKIPCFEGVV